MLLQGLNPYAVISLNNLDIRKIEKLRELYHAAPDSVKAKVPDVRRKMLEHGPTRELVKADDERTERLQRETTWKSHWLNRWLAMSDEEQDALIKRSVNRRREPLKE